LEGACKMEVHLEVLLELIFCTQPPNFGVEAHIEASTGVALTSHLKRWSLPTFKWQWRYSFAKILIYIFVKC
jgi:hypothetical protein